MTAQSDAITALTTQINALITSISRSNTRFVFANDIGTANDKIFTTIPALTSYDADVVLIGSIAIPNTSPTVTANISGLGQVPIVWDDGSTVLNGDVSRTMIFKMRVGAPGPRLVITTGISTANFTRTATVLGYVAGGAPPPPGGGGGGLTSVSVDGTSIIGNGTPSSPLSVSSTYVNSYVTNNTGPGTAIGQSIILGGGITNNAPPSTINISLGMTVSGATLMTGTFGDDGNGPHSIILYAPNGNKYWGNLTGTWQLMGWTWSGLSGPLFSNVYSQAYIYTLKRIA